jgi:cell division protein FtsW (lipid II flippase)
MSLPTWFHLGWAALLAVFALVALWPRRATPGEVRPIGFRAIGLQVALAVGVIGWAGVVLSEIARDHGPGLEVLGYELSPPTAGPPVLSLGTAAPADVILADPHGAEVHAVVRWDERAGGLVPMLWNAAPHKRLELNGVDLHDVELRSGMRIEGPRGGLAAGWEVSVEGSAVTLISSRGVHRLHVPLLRGLARKLPVIGDRIEVEVGRIVGVDGSLRLAEPGESILPGEGFVARVYLRGDVARLGFASPQDRASHPLRIRDGKRSYRPGDRAVALRSGDVLTLGYSRYEVKLGAEGTLSLIVRGRPGRLSWPDGDASVFGPDPGVLLVGDDDGSTLSIASLAEDRGFRRLGGVWRESDRGAARAVLPAGSRFEVPLADGARIRLRTARRADPAAALAGVASAADADFWSILAALALAYLLVTLLAAASGVVHALSSGVLHGAALLFAVGLICLYRLADPGDPLRADWALHQATLGLFGLGVAGVGLLSLIVRRRFGRRKHRRWYERLDGPNGDGAPASRLYLLALLGLALQLPFGEAGISVPGLGSVQPIELARTLLVVYLAYWTARAVEAKRRELRGREGFRERWSYMVHALPVIAVLVLCYGLHDISPILVFVAFVGVLYAMSLVRPEVRLWPPSALRESLGLEAVVLPLGAAALAWFVLGDPGGTVARRVAVWWDPWTSGDDAYQALTALWTAASGGVWGLGWTGANGVLPPAVKDDFVLALLAARGGAAAVTLVAATFGMILLSGVAALAVDDGHRAPAHRERSGLLAGAMLWMLIIQAGVVLGSATGGLPVMGQPLPFVAAAGSHLLFFCMPAIAVVLGATGVPVPLRLPARRRRRRTPASRPITTGFGPISRIDEPITLGDG